MLCAPKTRYKYLISHCQNSLKQVGSFGYLFFFRIEMLSSLIFITNVILSFKILKQQVNVTRSQNTHLSVYKYWHYGVCLSGYVEFFCSWLLICCGKLVKAFLMLSPLSCKKAIEGYSLLSDQQNKLNFLIEIMNKFPRKSLNTR